MKVLIIVLLNISIYALDFGPLISNYYVYSNRRIGSSVRESLIAQMPEPDIRVTSKNLIDKKCKKLKEIHAKVFKELWESRTDICRKLRVRLKKEAYLEKGNLVRYKAVDCTKTITAEVFLCEN